MCETLSCNRVGLPHAFVNENHNPSSHQGMDVPQRNACCRGKVEELLSYMVNTPLLDRSEVNDLLSSLGFPRSRHTMVSLYFIANARQIEIPEKVESMYIRGFSFRSASLKVPTVRDCLLMKVKSDKRSLAMKKHHADRGLQAAQQRANSIVHADPEDLEHETDLEIAQLQHEIKRLRRKLAHKAIHWETWRSMADESRSEEQPYVRVLSPISEDDADDLENFLFAHRRITAHNHCRNCVSGQQGYCQIHPPGQTQMKLQWNDDKRIWVPEYCAHHKWNVLARQWVPAAAAPLTGGHVWRSGGWIPHQAQPGPPPASAPAPAPNPVPAPASDELQRINTLRTLSGIEWDANDNDWDEDYDSNYDSDQWDEPIGLGCG